MTPSGARSVQAVATASSRRVRPEPAGPVTRTERPRESSRTRRSVSSERSSRTVSRPADPGGPAGTGGAAARAASVRSWAVSLPGTAGRSPGGQGSISLPSMGLTVTR